MIEFFNAQAQTFLNGMARIQQRQMTAQKQLSTGLRINSVADDPAHIGDLMSVRAQLDQTTQINSNLGLVKTETDTGESALQNAVGLLDQVTTLGAQGQPDTQSAATRSQLADQVGSVLQELVGVANTSVEGRYIFSGDSDQAAPYSVDLSQTYPVSTYGGSGATREVRAPDGSLFPVSKTAQEIFDSDNPDTNVFQQVTNLRNALQNNDQAGIESALGSLTATGTYLNTQLAFYGNVQDEVQRATDFGSNLTTQLQTQLSGIQDADMTQAITDLTQASLQQQAALGAEGQMPRTSLFNYLG
ncbi:MAG TPA: flagellin [Bryobacteraceae bacterium]|nr:flagellin [Bryobacteraceae bacterium]